MSHIIDWIASRFSIRKDAPEVPSTAREYNLGQPKIVKYSEEQASALMPDIYSDSGDTAPDLEIVQESIESEGFNPYDTSRLHVKDSGQE